MTISERNREIKKMLVKKYGSKNVKVKGGRGTAYGWLDIDVRVEDLEESENRNEVNKIKEAIMKMNVTMYTYSSDMGYESACMIVQVNNNYEWEN